MQFLRRHPASRGTRRLAAIAAAAVAISFAATGLTATASYADSGVISGTITFPAGLAPATDGGVALVQGDPTNGQEFVTSTTANADGSYEFAGLADGTYYLVFGYGAQEAVTESYGGTSDLAVTGYVGADLPDNATPVVVSGGVVTSGSDDSDGTSVDAALEVGGSISGTVTTPSGKPATPSDDDAGTIWAFDSTGAQLSQISPGPDGSGSTNYLWSTDSQGHYTISNLKPGDDYTILFASEGGTYAATWNGGNGDNMTYSDAPPISVTAGETTTVDQQLNAGEALSVTVESTGSTPKPIPNCEVQAVGGSYAPRTDFTSAAGTATLALTPGLSYRIGVSCTDGSELWPDGPTDWLSNNDGTLSADSSSALSVPAGTSSVTLKYDVASGLTSNDTGLIEGTVTGSDGHGAANVLLYLLDTDGNSVSSAVTDANGDYYFLAGAGKSYVVSVLPAGSADPNDGAVFVGNGTAGDFADASSSPIPLTAGDILTVNTTLTPTVDFTGTLVDAYGSPLPGCTVFPYDADTKQGPFVNFIAGSTDPYSPDPDLGSRPAMTDSTGAFDVSGLSAQGSYTLQVNCNGFPSGSLWYAATNPSDTSTANLFGAGDIQDGTATVLPQSGSTAFGTLTDPVDVIVGDTGDSTLSGTVQDSGGNAVSGAEAMLYQWNGIDYQGTDAVVTRTDGSYEFDGLGGGTYIVGVTSGTTSYWAGSGAQSTTEPSTTGAGIVLDGTAGNTAADLTLSNLVDITGTLTDTVGDVTDCNIYANAADGDYQSAMPDSTGAFLLTGLDAGASYTMDVICGDNGDDWYVTAFDADTNAATLGVIDPQDSNGDYSDAAPSGALNLQVPANITGMTLTYPGTTSTGGSTGGGGTTGGGTTGGGSTGGGSTGGGSTGGGSTGGGTTGGGTTGGGTTGGGTTGGGTTGGGTTGGGTTGGGTSTTPVVLHPAPTGGTPATTNLVNSLLGDGGAQPAVTMPTELDSPGPVQITVNLGSLNGTSTAAVSGVNVAGGSGKAVGVTTTSVGVSVNFLGADFTPPAQSGVAPLGRIARLVTAAAKASRVTVKAHQKKASITTPSLTQKGWYAVKLTYHLKVKVKLTRRHGKAVHGTKYAYKKLTVATTNYVDVV